MRGACWVDPPLEISRPELLKIEQNSGFHWNSMSASYFQNGTCFTQPTFVLSCGDCLNTSLETFWMWDCVWFAPPCMHSRLLASRNPKSERILSGSSKLTAPSTPAPRYGRSAQAFPRARGGIPASLRTHRGVRGAPGWHPGALWADPPRPAIPWGGLSWVGHLCSVFWIRSDLGFPDFEPGGTCGNDVSGQNVFI